MAPVCSIFLRDLTLIFLRILENFTGGSLGEANYKLKRDVSNSIQNVTVL